MMHKKYTIALFLSLCIGTAAWGLEASMEIMPAALSAPPSSLANVEILVSSPEQIAAVTFTVEYSSATATFVSATKGSALPSSWSIQVWEDVSGSNMTPGTDRNVYVQLIGSGVNWFTGDDRQAAVLRFQMASSICSETPLAFTADCDYTYLSTLQLLTICGPSLQGGQLRTTCISDAPGPLGQVLRLRNVPNPFNPSTVIEFEVPNEGPVQLRIFDATGRVVRSLLDRSMHGGHHEIVWNGQDDTGRSLPGGVYFYQLTSRSETVSRRMVLVK